MSESFCIPVTVAALRRFIRPGIKLELVKHSRGSKYTGVIREVKTVLTNSFSLTAAEEGRECWLDFPKKAEYRATAAGFIVESENTVMEYVIRSTGTTESQ